jgi:hypothetical protein
MIRTSWYKRNSWEVVETQVSELSLQSMTQWIFTEVTQLRTGSKLLFLGSVELDIVYIRG